MPMEQVWPVVEVMVQWPTVPVVAVIELASVKVSKPPSFLVLPLFLLAGCLLPPFLAVAVARRSEVKRAVRIVEVLVVVVAD
eukprot:scaffold3482_cov128-Skeletonema_marinoi.AAC.1